jgi:hypothetical protein
LCCSYAICTLMACLASLACTMLVDLALVSYSKSNATVQLAEYLYAWFIIHGVLYLSQVMALSYMNMMVIWTILQEKIKDMIQNDKPI